MSDENTTEQAPEERQRERALNLAVRWAADRGTATGTHPGTDGVLDVAGAFLQFLTGKEQAEEVSADG